MQNTALRIATSALRTSPTSSLHVYTQKHLQIDERKHFLDTSSKFKKIPNHPCTPIIKYRSHIRYIQQTTQRLAAYGTRLTQHSQTHNLTLPQITPTPTTRRRGGTGLHPNSTSFYQKRNRTTPTRKSLLFSTNSSQTTNHLQNYIQMSANMRMAGRRRRRYVREVRRCKPRQKSGCQDQRPSILRSSMRSWQPM